MLSRAGSSRLGVVCSDCGTPPLDSSLAGRPHPLVTGVTLLGLSGFALLLFFLTNWKPLPSHQAAQQRGMIKQLTTGEFVRQAELIEKGSHND